MNKEVKFCCNCKYDDKFETEEPCVNCINNVPYSVMNESDAPLLWEPIENEGNVVNRPISKLDRHAMICDEIKELYRKKNADYGDSFHTTFLEEGMAMSRIRLTDKLERFKRLTKSNEQNVKDENIRDTLIDLANYAIMTILELEGDFNE